MLSIGFAGSLFTGCGKESAGPNEATPRYDPTAQILGFLQDVQDSHNGTPKTGEGFSTDSAVWYVEAGLNYTLGNIGMAYTDLVVDSITVPLIFGAETTLGTSVFTAFEALVVELAPITTEEQHIVLIDVIEPLPGACDILAIVTIGSGYTKAAPNTTYTVKDCYYYGGPTTPQAYCACGCTTVASSYCANIIIQQRINSANNYALLPGQYLTEVETWRTWEYDNIANRYIGLYNPILLQAPYGDGYHDTKVFSYVFNNSPAGALCLNPAEMSYWTGNANSGTWSAILAIKNNFCPTKTFLSCQISPSTFQSSGFIPPAPAPATGLVYWHRTAFVYGRIVYPGTGG